MADYASASQVKSRLDITGSDYDTVLGELVTAASRWVDRYCRLPEDAFAVDSDSTRYYDEGAVVDDMLYLDAPLAQVTSVVNGDGTTLSSSSYWLWPRNRSGEPAWGIRLKSTERWLFSDVDSEIAVTGRFGYSTTAPSAVVEATAALAAWLFKRYQAAMSDGTANFELGQLVYSDAMPKQVRAMLETFQRLTV